MPCQSPGANMVAMALIYLLFIIINTTITRSLDMFHVSQLSLQMTNHNWHRANLQTTADELYTPPRMSRLNLRLLTVPSTPFLAHSLLQVVMNFCQYLSVINNFNVNW
jgi:hypothetical protein